MEVEPEFMLRVADGLVHDVSDRVQEGLSRAKEWRYSQNRGERSAAAEFLSDVKDDLSTALRLCDAAAKADPNVRVGQGGLFAEELKALIL